MTRWTIKNSNESYFFLLLPPDFSSLLIATVVLNYLSIVWHDLSGLWSTHWEKIDSIFPRTFHEIFALIGNWDKKYRTALAYYVWIFVSTHFINIHFEKMAFSNSRIKIPWPYFWYQSPIRILLILGQFPIYVPLQQFHYHNRTLLG